jgi:hypothetical protein
MLGADATITAGPFELNLQYLERRDDNPFFLEGFTEPAKTRGGFGELIYLPKGDDSKWYLAGLVNWVGGDFDELDYSSITAHFGRMLRRNIRATVEFTFVFNSTTEDHGRLALGLVTAF